MAEPVRAVCFPGDDPAFVHRVEDLVAGTNNSEPIRAAIEALLRETYPLALVIPRMPLGALERSSVWYVYRDGSIVGHDGASDT